MYCIKCKRKPSEIQEYVEAAKECKCAPERYVEIEEGTYNREQGVFYCTECYVAVGMPLGVAELM